MKNFLNILGLSELENEFKFARAKLFIKDCDTTLILLLKGEMEHEQYIVTVIEHMFAYLKSYNYRFFMFCYDFKDEKIKLKVLEKILINNFKYDICIENGKILIDFANDLNSCNDWETIKKICAYVGITNSLFSIIYPKNIFSLASVELDLSSNKVEKIKTFVSKFEKDIAKQVLIEDLPKNKKEMSEYDSPKISLCGKIISINCREIKNKFLYEWDITNYKDTILAKCFTNHKLEFNIGDIVEICGVVNFDEYSKDITVMIQPKDIMLRRDVQLQNEDEFYEPLMEKKSLNRTELHLHTKMSIQDGLCEPEDYFKYAKQFGITSLAITDHENIQSFPEIEKLSKKYNIKSIYGVELNVIDREKYKIFHTLNDKVSASRVAIDIETTGFSNNFDEITEISACKYENGVLLEYSVLCTISNYDKLSSKIVDLTGITKEMLKTEGIPIKDALEGLLEFIGSGVLVAHNAIFDISFLEKKIKKHLGMDINFSYIDTLNLSRNILKNDMKRFSLDKICSKLKIELASHHRAIYDARACLEIYYSLMDSIEKKYYEEIPKYENNDITVIVKINSKDNKKKITDFLNVNQYQFVEEENGSEKRINSKFIINVSSEAQREKILQLLLVNNKMKILKVSTSSKIYSQQPKLLNDKIELDEILNYSVPTHVTCLVKNQKGMKTLFRLISRSFTQTLSSKGAVVFLDQLLSSNVYKDNLLFGSSCMNGLFKHIYEKDYDDNFLKLYDYIEIQPLDTYLGISDSVVVRQNVIDTVKIMVDLSEATDKTLVVSTDAHYILPQDKYYRDVYIKTPVVAGGMHPLYRCENSGTHRLYSTSDLIDVVSNDYNFDYNFTKKLVVDNTEKINKMIDNDVRVTKDKLYAPTDDFLKDKIIDIVGYPVPSVLEEFNKIINEGLKQYSIDGVIHPLVKARVDKELKSIIGNNFYGIYYISYLLVKKSNSDGYIVGSRGSVGSSFVAYLMGITEVNALCPHYHCTHCHYSIFKDDTSDETRPDLRHHLDSVDDGFDLTDATCPVCGQRLSRDGHSIPFETFLGFEGDKVPDIDLNFSGDYQSKAHDFCAEVFGKNYAFRAGTIGTVAHKTAVMHLKKYMTKDNEQNIGIQNAELSRRAKKLEGAKRTTGQHPGGIVVVPVSADIFDFTPVQYPANSKQKWLTTHFDYHSFEANLLKLDILGHDDPTIMKFLMDKVKENPENYPFDNVKDIPVNDKNVYKFLNPNDKNIIESTGIPELGTTFVKKMLNDIRPQSFADLVKISGLSHGTDVWSGNAQELINGNTEFGKIPFKESIGCRDDIMVQLISRGVDFKVAFDIMEFVRKGKVQANQEKWQEYLNIMKTYNIPKWYSWSCDRIKYMFPKAHAVAYVLSAMRIAWFKANRPLDFYQAFFTVRSSSFDVQTIAKNDALVIQQKIANINNNKYSTAVEIDSIQCLETAAEMINLGLTFEIPRVNDSHYKTFIQTSKNSLLMPFSTLDGVGDVLAENIYNTRIEERFNDLNDLKTRSKANKKFIEAMTELGAITF